MSSIIQQMTEYKLSFERMKTLFDSLSDQIRADKIPPEESVDKFRAEISSLQAAYDRILAQVSKDPEHTAPLSIDELQELVGTDCLSAIRLPLLRFLAIRSDDAQYMTALDADFAKVRDILAEPHRSSLEELERHSQRCALLVDTIGEVNGASLSEETMNAIVSEYPGSAVITGIIFHKYRISDDEVPSEEPIIPTLEVPAKEQEIVPPSSPDTDAIAAPSEPPAQKEEKTTKSPEKEDLDLVDVRIVPRTIHATALTDQKAAYILPLFTRYDVITSTQREALLETVVELYSTNQDPLSVDDLSQVYKTLIDEGDIVTYSDRKPTGELVQYEFLSKYGYEHVKDLSLRSQLTGKIPLGKGRFYSNGKVRLSDLRHYSERAGAIIPYVTNVGDNIRQDLRKKVFRSVELDDSVMTILLDGVGKGSSDDGKPMRRKLVKCSIATESEYTTAPTDSPILYIAATEGSFVVPGSSKQNYKFCLDSNVLYIWDEKQSLWTDIDSYLEFRKSASSDMSVAPASDVAEDGTETIPCTNEVTAEDTAIPIEDPSVEEEEEEEEEDPESLIVSTSEPIIRLIADNDASLQVYQEKHDAYKERAYDLMIDGRYPEALTMMRALANVKAPNDNDKDNTNAGFEFEYALFALALDDPAYDQKSYSPWNLQAEVFPDLVLDEDIYRALYLAIWLRACFKPGILDGWNALRDPTVQMYLTSACGSLGLGDAYYDVFFKTILNARQGYAPAVLNAILGSQNQDDMLRAIQERAQYFLSFEANDKHLRVRATRNALFNGDRATLGEGMTSTLCTKVLMPIANGETWRVKEVRDALTEIVGSQSSGDDQGNGQKDRINEYIQRIWDRPEYAALVSAQNRADHMIGNALTSTIKRVRDIADMAFEWISLCEASTETALAVDVLDDCRAEYRHHLETAHDTIMRNCRSQTNKRNAAALSALAEVCRELSVLLEKGIDPNRDRFFYINCLKSDKIEVVNGIPGLSENFAPISRFHVCHTVQLMANDIVNQTDRRWSDILDSIYQETYNCGHARQIEAYLRAMHLETNWKPSCSLDSIVSHALKGAFPSAKASALASVEEGLVMGWYPDTKTHIQLRTDIQARFDHYAKTQNYGFFARETQEYSKRLKLLRDEQKHCKYSGDNSLEKLCKDHPDVNTELLEEAIRTGRFNVADDCIRQLRTAGHQPTLCSSSLTENSENALESFIRRQSEYLELFSDTNGSVASVMQMLRARNDLDNWDSWAASWPATPTQIEGLIERFFGGFGWSNVSITQQDHQPPNELFHYHVRLENNATQYQHPFGAYGSQLASQGLHVFWLFKSMDANGTHTAISNRITSSIQAPTLFILDYALSPLERQRLAHKLREHHSGRPPILVLDRLLFVHCAQYPSVIRWKIFLECALPYSYLNPYINNSDAGNLCPDMFIGRQVEIGRITSFSNTAVIYGGRQLGKTATLYQICQDKYYHDPENGRWAVYVCVKDHSGDKVAQAIYDKLIEAKFLQPEPQQVAITWDRLADIMIARLQELTGDRQYLLLLLDEMDTFVKQDRKQKDDSHPHGFADSYKLDDIRKKFGTRFKFVIAGVHNILRSVEDIRSNNNPFIHYGTPMSISPLDYEEARMLLERPLFYLGFRIQDSDRILIPQILAATNYYPGLIHFYAMSLVDEAMKNLPLMSSPPYYLRDSLIHSLLGRDDFNKQITDKFFATIELSEHYRKLCYALAYLYYEQPENASVGYTVQDICGIYGFVGFDLPENGDEAIKQYLDELKEMYILGAGGLAPSHDGQGSDLDQGTLDPSEPRYVFYRMNFRSLFGSSNRVMNELLKCTKEKATEEV